MRGSVGWLVDEFLRKGKRRQGRRDNICFTGGKADGSESQEEVCPTQERVEKRMMPQDILPQHSYEFIQTGPLKTQAYSSTYRTQIGSFDATVRLWDCKSQSTKPIQIFEESKDSVSSLHVVGHEIVTGSVDGQIRIYDLRMGMVYVDVIGRMCFSLALHYLTSTPRPLPHSPSHTHLISPSSILEPITSIRQTLDGNAILVSTLDSTIRLMDKGNGQMLQHYKSHLNTEYRVRSTLGLGDAVVVSGSEDGSIYAWDLLEGKVVEKLERPHAGKVVSAVAFNNGTRKEWASAGVDGEWAPRGALIFQGYLILSGYI